MKKQTCPPWRISNLKSQSDSYRIRNHMDYLIPAFIFITALCMLFSACQRNNDAAPQKVTTLVVAIKLSPEGCPYPPGCDAFISQLAMAQFRTNDATVNVAYKESSLEISTTNPSLYKGLTEVNVSPKGLAFVSNISSTIK